MTSDQQALLDALLGRGEPPASLTGGPRGLAAYQGNLRALSAQALGLPFERLREALGDGDFAALAWSFWRAHPPRRGDLGEWGGGLAGFLTERAGEASGLPGLARLGWALHQAERAADAELDAGSLNLLASVPPERLRLHLRPGVVLIDVEGRPTLVWRQGWQGQWQALEPGDARFMQALLAGSNLAVALDAAAVKGLAGEADFDFGAWLQAALQKSWLLSAMQQPES